MVTLFSGAWHILVYKIINCRPKCMGFFTFYPSSSEKYFLEYIVCDSLWLMSKDHQSIDENHSLYLTRVNYMEGSTMINYKGEGLRDIAETYRQALVVDVTYQQIFVLFMESISWMEALNSRFSPFQVVGSFTEGSWVSHILHPNKLEFEIDFMIQNDRTTLTDADFIVDPSQRGLYGTPPGSVHPYPFVDPSSLPETYIRNGWSWDHQHFFANAYHGHVAFHLLWWCAIKRYSKLNLIKLLWHFIRTFPKQSNRDVPLSTEINSEDFDQRFNVKYQGPALNMSFEFVDKKSKIEEKVSGDFVNAIPLETWPPDLHTHQEAWVKRERQWPDKDTIRQALQQGCHLVQKPRKVTIGPLTEFPSPFQFQVSFSVAEGVISQARSVYQRLAYLMAKTLFYRYLKLENDTEPGHVSSYMLKTTMMWFLEETPKDLWTDNNVLNLLKQLLQKFQMSVEKGTMPHYFLPEINLLSDISQKAQEKTNKAMKDIIDNLQERLKVIPTIRMQSFILRQGVDMDTLQKYIDASNGLKRLSATSTRALREFLTTMHKDKSGRNYRTSCNNDISDELLQATSPCSHSNKVAENVQPRTSIVRGLVQTFNRGLSDTLSFKETLSKLGLKRGK